SSTVWCYSPGGPNGQMFAIQGAVTAPEHRPLHDVAQLPHISRPGIRQEHLPSSGIDPAHILAVLGAELLEKVLGQENGVFSPFPERREVKEDDRQAEIEIAAKVTLLDLP